MLARVRRCLPVHGMHACMDDLKREGFPVRTEELDTAHKVRTNGVLSSMQRRVLCTVRNAVHHVCRSLTTCIAQRNCIQWFSGEVIFSISATVILSVPRFATTTSLHGSIEVAISRSLEVMLALCFWGV